ncbi:LysM peptidoglycan-binding domain-containing protein [Georgenia muralis]|uniref:LysM domain-containing protein n=1 Tax=Georgenia muralis TaxID=154117 RepID=A0A3N5A891_9MICO|nr:LysM peptidoglycan-binding domain-containing protein [Georgenia muralis]RPF27901.1 LysM domain-containing protein [Georgenia muralis]
MSALVAHPAWQPSPQTRPRPGVSADPRRPRLQLVGPGFVPSPAPSSAPSADPGPAVAARPAARRAAPLRLTALGRRVAAVAALLVALVLALALGTAAGQAVSSGATAQTVTHTVVPGETLWAVAGSAAGPGQDVRDVVAQIVQLNALATEVLEPGQALLVPAAG